MTFPLGLQVKKNPHKKYFRHYSTSFCLVPFLLLFPKDQVHISLLFTADNWAFNETDPSFLL